MSETSPLLLLGIGTSGARIARGVARAFGEGLRYAIADTDARTGDGSEHFTLLGGARLAGNGSGGDIVAARLAAEDSIHQLDSLLEGVRLAFIVTCLGGGTGGGATLEAVKHLSNLGIPSIVFATTPFQLEGNDARRNSRGVQSMIEDYANASFFIPLDKLVGETDNLNDALRQATDILASGVTLFWRLLEKPGYIKLDAERIRHILQGAGRGRFATVTVQGPDRAKDAVDKLIRSEMLALAQAPVKSVVCGVLAGDDLRLSELTTISEGLIHSFGDHVTFNLGTVNDEETFTQRLSVVVMLLETNARSASGASHPNSGTTGHGNSPTSPKYTRFANADRTEWRGENLDIPTYIRRGITLDF